MSSTSDKRALPNKTVIYHISTPVSPEVLPNGLGMLA
jgi:hypothetical protein